MRVRPEAGTKYGGSGVVDKPKDVNEKDSTQRYGAADCHLGDNFSVGGTLAVAGILITGHVEFELEETPNWRVRSERFRFRLIAPTSTVLVSV